MLDQQQVSLTTWAPKTTLDRKALDETLTNLQLNLNIWGRNCDRAVEWSTAFEGIEQFFTLLLGDASHTKAKPNGVE